MTRNRFVVVVAISGAATTTAVAVLLSASSQEPSPRAIHATATASPSGAVVSARAQPAGDPSVIATVSSTATVAAPGVATGSIRPVTGTPPAPATSPQPAQFDTICEVPSHECVTAEEARTWWLRGSFLAPGRGAEYVVSSMRGGRAAAVTDVEAQPALMVVFGSRSNRVSTADVKQLVADGAVILTGRMVGRGAPPEEDVSGSERRIVVRGRPGVILSIAANAEREGIRLVTWFTQGSGGETISWSALDRPDFRSDAQLIALLNELTES